MVLVLKNIYFLFIKYPLKNEKYKHFLAIFHIKFTSRSVVRQLKSSYIF